MRLSNWSIFRKKPALAEAGVNSGFSVRKCDNAKMLEDKLMLYGSSTAVFALTAALMVTMGGAQAADDEKYPNWKGQWDYINPRFGGQGVKFDPTKAFGPAQQAPLTSSRCSIMP